MYQELLEIINTYIYNGQMVEGSYEELVAILMATIGCIAMVIIPFVVVKAVIDLITR